jgi:K+-sensing histidine kinase KdpD
MTTPNPWWKRQFEAIAGTVISLPGIPVTLVEYYAIPQAGRHSAGGRWKPASGAAVGIGCFSLIMLVAVCDRLTGGRINFALLYLLAAAYAAWSGGRRVGIFIAVVSVFAGFINEAGLHSRLGVSCWNFTLQLAILLFVVLRVAAFRGLTTRLEQRAGADRRLGK